VKILDVRFAQQQAKPSNPEPQPGVSPVQVSKPSKAVKPQQTDFQPVLDTSGDQNPTPGAPIRKQSISERMKKLALAQSNSRAGGPMILPMLTAKNSADGGQREHEQKSPPQDETQDIEAAMPAGADYGHMPRQENTVPAAHFSTHPHLPSQVYHSERAREPSPQPSPHSRQNPSPQPAADAFRQGTPSYYGGKPGASSSPDIYSGQGNHQSYGQNTMRSSTMEVPEYGYNQRPPQQ
jgi:hypothetical protein